MVAAETARFGVPEVKRGLVAAGGGRCGCRGGCPTPIALEMLLTGDPLRAERAAEMGLVNRLTPRAARSTGALALAATIAANGPLAVAATKRIARAAPTGPSRRAGAGRASSTGPVFASRGRPGGRHAFAEKRAPVWKGR